MIIRTLVIKDLWAGVFQCSACECGRHFHLTRFKTVLYFLFIPLFSFSGKRMLVCSSCGAYIELSRKEYKAKLAEQKEKLEKAQIPPEVVLNDFSPREMGMGRHIVSLVFTGFLMLLMVVAMLSMMVEILCGDIAQDLFTIAFGASAMIGFSAPFVICLKNYMFKKKKKALYDKISQSIQ